MSIIPPFGPGGLLPPGDYGVTFDELRRSSLVLGPPDAEDGVTWDQGWRAQLVHNLETLTHELWSVGIGDVFADGSFAEDKAHPNDIDGYFVCDLEHLASSRLERDLNLVNPLKVWTWDPDARRAFRGYPKRQLPMWHHYRVELYPHVVGAELFSGIRDRHGHELEFPAAFRQCRRDGAPRGIIKLLKEDGS